MAEVLLQGHEAYGDIASERQREDKRIDFDKVFASLMPFARFQKFLPKGERPKNEVVKWFNSDYFPSTISVANSGAYSSGDTTIKVGATYQSRVVVGDLLQNPVTREIMRVTGTSSTDSITISRSLGGTAAGAIAATQELLILPNVAYEGSGIPESKVKEPESGSNYIQHIKESWKVTGRADRVGTIDSPGATKLYKRRRAEKIQEFIKRMEYSFWFGEQGVHSDSSSNRYTLMGGVEEFIRNGSSRTYDASAGALTWAMLDDIGLQAFENSDTDVMWAFIPYNVLSLINQLMYNKVTLNTQDSTKLGVEVRDLLLSRGKLKLIVEPWFKVAPHTGYMFILDKRCFKKVETLAVTEHDDVQDKKTDVREGYIEWEGSIQCEHTELLTLVTGIAAS